MARIKRLERIVALTKELNDHPFQLFPFSYFCEKFTVAKSTLSEDVQTVRNGLSTYDLGIIETVAGASGGVRFIPYHSPEADNEFLWTLAKKLNDPSRLLRIISIDIENLKGINDTYGYAEGDKVI